MKKRVLSVLLAVALVVSMAVPAFAAVASSTLINDFRFLVCDDTAAGRYHIDLTKITNPTQEVLVSRWQQIKKDMSDPNRNVVVYFYWCKVWKRVDFISYPKDGITTKINDGDYQTTLTAKVPDISEMRSVAFITYAETTRPNNYTNGYFELKDNYIFPASGCTIGLYPNTQYTGQSDYKSFSYFTGQNLITDNRFYYADSIKQLNIIDSFPSVTSSHTLMVNYQYEDGRQAAPSVTQTVEEGASYSVKSPTLLGYTPSKATVAGEMGTEDINETVVYNKTAHTLTIQYQFEDGKQAAPPETRSLTEGSTYEVTSPIVEGYTPNRSVVSGSMGVVDKTETVVYSKTAHTLTIQYQFEGGGQAAPPETRSLTDGATYEVTSPTVVGYTPDRVTVSGTMGATDKTETVTYEINSHVLTVNYQYEDGTQAAEPSVNIVNYGAPYSVLSPTIAGYRPDRATVAGTMPDQDVTATVTYIGQSSNLTILYQYEDGSQAAPTYTADLAEGSSYEVRSPDIKGYMPDIEYVSGTVPEGGTTVTVTYKAVKYTLTIDYQYEDGTQAAETVTRSLASGERYEILSPTVDGYKPSTATVTGFMPSRDKTVLVTYAKDSSSSGGGSSSTPSGGGGDWEYSDPWGEPSADFWNQLFGGYTFQGPFFSGSGGSGSGAGKRYPWDGLDQDALLGELLGDYEYHNPYPGGG